MEPAVKLALEHLRDEPDVAINTKVHKMLQLLKAKGQLYQQVLPVDSTSPEPLRSHAELIGHA